MKKEELKRYLPLVVVILLAVVSFLIIQSYLIPLLSAFILAYLARPLYKNLERRIPKQLAALFCVVLILIIILLPITAVVGGIVSQTYTSLNSATLNEYISKASELALFKNMQIDIQVVLSKALTFIVGLFTAATQQIPSFVLGSIITLVGVYYMLIDWERMIGRIQKYIPITNKEKLTSEIAKTTSNLVYGTLFIALIEFVVAATGFWIAGVHYHLLLAALIALFAFIPGLGPGAVWIPLLIIEVIQQDYRAVVGVLITGLIISVAIDFFLRTQISSKGSNLHPLIILVGILGGVAMFGIFGFVVGPLLLGYTIKLIEEIAAND